MRNNHATIIMPEGKLSGRILVVEYLVVCEAIILTIQKNLQRIIIERDFQLVVNSSKEKMYVPKKS